ncbi:hypothetical protein ACFV5G_24275 [Streptomyces sp. NPDC059766]|uniref:hypothetical protein n=1 Tax=Streptomyces sp. NPDC059766 TaxID=3346940 RepID=UPI003665167C
MAVQERIRERVESGMPGLRLPMPAAPQGVYAKRTDRDAGSRIGVATGSERLGSG